MPVAIDWAEVRATWTASGRTSATIAVYMYWARRFIAFCVARGLDPIAHLTPEVVEQCVARPARPRRRRGSGPGRVPFNSVRALSYALAAMGHAVPSWQKRIDAPGPSGLVAEFVGFRVRHRGVAPSTTPGDIRVATMFLGFLRTRDRRPSTLRIVDIDAFVIWLAARRKLKTVAGVCSTLRAFLRFLHATGRIHHDLSVHVVAPRVRSVDRPPRALPWDDVRRILRAIDVRRAPGRRDFALFLMMVTYGMEAGEIIGLQLDDIDWRAQVLHVRRPKTGVATALPLLDPIAQALATYIRLERPSHAPVRAVFVSHGLPHRRLSASSAIRHRLDKYAAIAGVHGRFLGTHVFRHTHATRQIEHGVPAKIVGDILGHRHPSSTSFYVRGAIGGLRAIALPVPR